jgi:hypothetical protein
MKIDLQLHSTYSDGYLTPAKLADFAVEQGMKVVSLTDHNTVAGQEEFRIACARQRIKVIPGLELYVKVGSRKLNILWYNYRANSPELQAILEETRRRRRRNMRHKLEQLVKLGFYLKVEAVLAKYPNYVPINKIVDELLAVPYNQRKVKRELGLKVLREEDLMTAYFFDKQLSPLRDAYISLERVLQIRQKIGGQIIFCHPGHHNKMRGKIIPKLKKMGLDGLELLSPHHSHEAIMYIQYLAQIFNFITTGGSDFHKFESPDKKIRYSGQWFEIDSKYLRQINRIIGK